MGSGFTVQIGDGAKFEIGEKLKTPGVDFGPGGLVVVHRSIKPEGVADQYVVVRCSGYTGWSGVGFRAYNETSYRILRVYQHHSSAKESLNGIPWTAYMAEEIIQEEPGRKWKSCLTRLAAKADELQRKAKGWGQPNPRMQLAALLAAVQGDIANIKDGIKNERQLPRIEAWLADAQAILKAMPEGSWE